MKLSPKFLFCTIVAIILGASVLIGAALHGAEETAKPRIVVLGSCVGEITHALGLGGQIVGRDTSCVYPEAVAQLPTVGYHRTISAEGTLSLNPTLVLHTEAAGPPAALQQLESAGVKLVSVGKVTSLECMLKAIHIISEAAGAHQAGKKLGAVIKAKAEQVIIANAGRNQPRVLFLMSGTESGRYFVGGKDTAAHAMITYSGGENVADELAGFKMLGVESVLALKPEVIVVPSDQGGHGVANITDFAELPGIAQTPAAQNKRIFAVDLVKTLGMGPRLPEAIAALAQKIHADANSEPASKY